MSAYTALASGYDGLMADADYRRRADYLARQLRRAGAETVVDLGCGTGTIAWLLAERGWRVTAVDASADMLAQASARDGANRPLFVCQDMARLRLPEEVDAAVSTLDALNYLTRERDLREAFRRVFRALRPGGVFLFDVNTPDKLRRMDGELYMDETEDTVCCWRTFFSPARRVCTYQVDLFRRRADGAWDRSFEEHRQRAWEREELAERLEDAGFAGVRFFADLTVRPPREDEDRWIVRAEKRGEEPRR